MGAWVQPRAGGTGEQPFLAFANGSGVTELVLAYDPAAQRFLAREGSAATVGNTPAAPDGWHHVMLSVLNDAATLYVNGQEAAAFTATVRPVANGNLRLGSDGSTFFAGQLDDVVLYNRELPVAGQFTHMVWLSLPAFAAGSYYPIFSDEDGTNPARFPSLAVVDDGKLRATFNGEEYVTRPLLAANAWNFVATTFDGASYRFYVNGVLAEETTLFAGDMPPSDAQSFNIGRGLSSSTPYGQVTLDDIALFRQALSAEEIAVHYQQAWRATALSVPRNGADNLQGLATQATVQWSYPVPSDINGSVEIRLRTTDTNGNVSFGAQGNERWSGSIVTAPQAITLAGFMAIPQRGAIRIVWETASEIDNAGFNLFRATSPDAQDATLLNTALITSEAPGSLEGASYEWVDSDVETIPTYYYWLEAVDLNGEASRFGPVSASLEAPTALALTEFNSGDASPLGQQLIALLLVTLALVFVVRQKRR